MGLVFGATMQRNTEIEKGICTVEVIDGYQNDPFLKGFGPRFEIENFHWASISIASASKLERLARSSPKPGISTGCENYIVHVTGQPYYGAQFHPENSEADKLFLRNFLELSNNQSH